MIGRLAGTLLESDFTSCLIDVNGVGYDVLIPLSTFDKLPQAGNDAVLYIHTHVREDAITLFGFATAEERKLFRMLINVSAYHTDFFTMVINLLTHQLFQLFSFHVNISFLWGMSG